MKTMLKQNILLLLSLAVISVSCSKLVFRPHSEEVLKAKLSLKIDCPDKSRCADNNTCCEVPSGKFACCDLPEAVCCADKMHCCPKKSVCDVEHNKCIHSSGLLTNWHRHEEEAEEEVLSKMRLIKSQIQLCPDKVSFCSDEETCCLLPGGMYGCCPEIKAVCCEDKEHCCPMGTICNVSHSSCDHSSPDMMKVPWSKKKLALDFKNGDKRVVCPDVTSYCNDGQTCCLLSSGKYGCCPYPMAVCCSDKVHCCPNGYVCDASGNLCTKGSVAVPSSGKLESSDLSLRVICPDKTSYCNDGQTCCLLMNGKYGCCPYQKAECCGDRVHCCPNGYKCDATGQLCIKGSLTVPSSANIESNELSAKENRVICPDHASYCEDGQTCCLLLNGQYGCCPYPKAECCSDKIHCCPSGYACDATGQFCNKGSLTVPSSAKIESTKLSVKENRVVCPDQTSYCNDGQTCCLLLNGQYGCCPYPKAECCSDKIHCCPSGYACDATGQFCNKGSLTVPSSAKIESNKLSVKENIVVCPNGAYCFDGQTCCLQRSGIYGCCPYAFAVCCWDNIHCCPYGYWCDSTGAQCFRGLDSIPSSKKLEAIDPSAKEDKHKKNNLLKSEEKVPMMKAVDTKIVPCDNTSFCENGQTCCKGPDDSYKCCPLKGASCCQDGINCCHKWCVPLINKCFPNVQKNYFPELEEQSVKSLKSQKMIWCDAARTLYCREGFECDMSDLACKQKTKVSPLGYALKAPRLSHVCPAWARKDLKQQCQNGETCCLTSKSENFIRCCPYKDGICCNGGTYCCPSGSVCDDSKGMCKSTNQEFWVGMTEMKAPHLIGEKPEGLLVIEDVYCGDNSSCPDGTTCCQQLDGHFTCCQFKNAVCCKDLKHCCPQGYKCDLASQSCTTGSPEDVVKVELPWDFHARTMASRGSVQAGAVVECRRTSEDPTHSCPDGQKCCFRSGDEEPVCCRNDGSTCCDGFCCPSGLQCGAEKGVCLGA